MLAKHLVEEPFCVSDNFWCRKIRDRRRGYDDFPSKTCCLRVTKHLVEEPFCVSESFWCQKIRDRRRGYHDFPSKLAYLTVPEHFVEEPFCVSDNFWYRKMLGVGDGVITIFRRKFVVSG